jgi:hypothetical protein
MAPPSNLKRALLFSLALSLFIIAAILICVGWHSNVLGLFGVLAAAAGAQTARRARGLPAVPVWSPEKQKALALKPWHWFVGFALVVPVVVSVAWLYRIAQNGYNGPVSSLYLFAVSFMVCGGWWAVLFTRWLHTRRI